MILLIDNHDSFTFNIVDMLRGITDMRIDVISSSQLDVNCIEKYSHIILSPGGSLPEEYPTLFEVLKRYIGTLPIMGICLGHQAICKHFGSELTNYSAPLHGVNTAIVCDATSTLFSGKESMVVGRYHSWVVKSVDSRLKVVARDEKGDIMAIENNELKLYGVQFHPESYISEGGKDLLINFLRCSN